MQATRDSLFERARECIAIRDPARKVVHTLRVARLWREGGLALAADAPPDPIGAAGRPERPELVPPSGLRQRKLSTPAGRAAFLHALAHIEFNAINLAWDAVYRFRDMPVAFYGDWVAVARDEARHFRLLAHRLQDSGHDYGDFPAHAGLWDMARRTADDLLLRMALVPRVLEARGLDVTPAMIERLRQAGDRRSAAVLGVILRDEIGHVEAGSRWFRHVCRRRGLEPARTFDRLLREHLHGRISRPLNHAARLQAGFSREEIDLLEAMAGGAA